MIEIVLAQQGMGMQDGTVLRWLKAEGETVSEGESIVEVEAAKSVIEVPAPASGVLSKIMVQADENVPVQSVLGVIENNDALPSGKKDASIEKPTAHGASANGASAAKVPAVEPRARRAAAELNIDLATVKGSGPGGRVTEEDVRQSANGSREPRGKKARATPHSGVKREIARRLTDAKRDVPHYYVTVHCEVDDLLALRGRLNARDGATKISVNDLIVKAVALALGREPQLNASWTEDAVIHHPSIDIAVAVATARGLMTPVVRDVGDKTVDEVAAELRALGEKAENGRLKPDEYEGGGFTVSNLGMFGVSEFTAIINPPHAGILAVGAAEPRVIARDGAPVVATMLTCTLSTDHRVVDGADAAKFLNAFKQLLENPEELAP